MKYLILGLLLAGCIVASGASPVTVSENSRVRRNIFDDIGDALDIVVNELDTVIREAEDAVGTGLEDLASEVGSDATTVLESVFSEGEVAEVAEVASDVDIELLPIIDIELLPIIEVGFPLILLP